jgi:putative tricarboxylic transport membrane protein
LTPESASTNFTLLRVNQQNAPISLSTTKYGGISMMVKRSFLPLFLVFTFLSPATGGWGQNYEPSRPIELVVHSAPGGGSDVFARAVVEIVEKEKLLPQAMRVVNKTEGASDEAMAYMMEKKRDDHTLAIFTNTWVATPLTSKKAKYTSKDLTPVVRLVLEPTIAVVRADSPYKNMNDFVEAAKRDPGGLKQAGGSATAIESLTGLLIQSATGAKWAFVSTPSVKDRIANLLSGNVQIIIPQPQDVNEHIAAGKVRQSQRSPKSVSPSCPTFRL